MRLHDLRHAKASLSLDAGIPPNDVADQLGWASTKMLFDTYGHARRTGHTGMGEVLDL
jgi:integrase